MEAITNFLAKLPEVNGTFEIGIAANVDPSLADADKLRVFQVTETMPIKHSAGASALWAYRRYAALPDLAMRRNYACAAYAAVSAGLISVEDGDVVVGNIGTEVAVTADEAPHLAFTTEEVQRCLTAIVSTKINWWTMNHHTGQGDIQGYAKKVATAMFGYKPDDDGLKVYCKFAHTVGHWASTKIILGALGIKGVLKVKPIGDTIKVLGSEDLKLRLKTPPAGTHRHNIVAGITKRLMMHYIARYCSALGELQPVIRSYVNVLSDPAFYHIGAKYLTGKDREDFDDNLANVVLGRLVTFVKHFAPNASIADSPHVSSREGATKRWKDQTYEDYDSAFDELCRGVRTAGTTIPEDTLKQISGGMRIEATGMIMSKQIIVALKRDLGQKVTMEEEMEAANYDMPEETEQVDAGNTPGRPLKVRPAIQTQEPAQQ